MGKYVFKLTYLENLCCMILQNKFDLEVKQLYSDHSVYSKDLISRAYALHNLLNFQNHVQLHTKAHGLIIPNMFEKKKKIADKTQN